MNPGRVLIFGVSVKTLQGFYTDPKYIKQQDNCWIGWIEEVPGVNCQELTREELLESLTITLREALEFNRMDARHAAGERYEELNIAV